MIAKRDRIDPIPANLAIQLRRQYRPRLGVFGVGDHQVHRVIALEIGQLLLDDLPAGCAEDVAEECHAEYGHGQEV